MYSVYPYMHFYAGQCEQHHVSSESLFYFHNRSAIISKSFPSNTKLFLPPNTKHLIRSHYIYIYICMYSVYTYMHFYAGQCTFRPHQQKAGILKAKVPLSLSRSLSIHTYMYTPIWFLNAHTACATMLKSTSMTAQSPYGPPRPAFPKTESAHNTTCCLERHYGVPTILHTIGRIPPP